MNKYQEALEELSYPLDDSSCGGCKCGESDCHCKKRTAVETLQELVDKSTPKKPINKTKGDEYIQYENCNIVICPHCGKRLKVKSRGNYCDKCGGALDWWSEQ